jgi:hypothetical protein
VIFAFACLIGGLGVYLAAGMAAIEMWERRYDRVIRRHYGLPERPTHPRGAIRLPGRRSTST